MISVSLVPYVSNHNLNNVSVDGLAYRDFCLQFKSGHDWATKKAAMMVGDGLKRNNMKNVVFLCVPASTRTKTMRRYKRFSSMVCSICGAEDGFSYLWRDSDYKAEHLSRSHYNPEAYTSRLLMDEDKISGKKIVLFDDVCRSGNTMQAAIGEIQKHGGKVAIAITLGRTVHRA